MKQNLAEFIENVLKTRGSTIQLDRDHLWEAITGALDGRRLINNLAETLRISAAETEQLLIEAGFGDVVARIKLASGQKSKSGPSKNLMLDPDQQFSSPFPEMFSVECRPPLHERIALSDEQYETVSLLLNSVAQSVASDPFLALYRTNILQYHDDFVAREGSIINAFLEQHFGPKAERLRYLINSGIGANEQFNHFAAKINNADRSSRLTWIIANSSRHLHSVPSDANVENTLFMEFSRSGKTEETVKIHELTPVQAVRIVFANSGPLRALGLRDAKTNLTLGLPDEVSGRFGRNKTPILLAPMLVAGMDTRRYWLKIQEAIQKTDLSFPSSLPAQLARFIYLHQLLNHVDGVYLGCNDETLLCSADEFVQFWNEGVNKESNDILMTRYFGLLRDSHASLEGVLGNASTKLGIFLLAGNFYGDNLPPFALPEVNPINPEHEGLRFYDEERVLAQANYEHMSQVMPCFKIQLLGPTNLEQAAVLGQLWSDVTFYYSKLRGVDPGSNPEVKHVRDRAAALLAAEALRRRTNPSRTESYIAKT